MKYIWLWLVIITAGISHVSQAMYYDPQHMISLMVTHNELSPEQEKELQAIFTEHEVGMKHDRGCYILIPREAVYRMLPFIKNSNDPVMVDRLGIAARDNEEELVPVLVEQAKVDVSAVNPPLIATPFFGAVVFAEPGSFDIMRYLLDKGADIDARDNLQSTPLATVAELGFGWLFKPSRIERIKFLLEHGARLDDINEKHEDVLTIAEGAVKRRPVVTQCDLEELEDIKTLVAQARQQRKDGAA